MPIDAKQSALSAYNAAAAGLYNHPVNTFWQWAGQQTVSRLELKAGAKILDVCCRSGASALGLATKIGI
jgi:methylase of polypeptide subunit release factors